jgi:hypothetical protein
MPKNKEIGGCAGTQYGCCSDGVTAKVDADGTNCSHSKVKTLITLKLTGDYYKVIDNTIIQKKGVNLGKLNLNLENHHNSSILTLEYKSSKLAKQYGMKSLTCKSKINYSNIKSKKYLRQFFKTLPNTKNQNSGYNRNDVEFLYLELQILTTKMTNYLMGNSIKNYFFKIYLNNSSYPSSVNSFSTNSTTVPTWEPGTIAAVISTVFVATITYFWAPIATDCEKIADAIDVFNRQQGEFLDKIETDIEVNQQAAAEKFGELEDYVSDTTGIDYDWNTKRVAELYDDARIHELTPNVGPLKVDPFKP